MNEETAPSLKLVNVDLEFNSLLTLLPIFLTDYVEFILITLHLEKRIKTYILAEETSHSPILPFLES